MLDWYVNTAVRRLEEEARARDQVRRWWRYLQTDRPPPVEPHPVGEVIEADFGEGDDWKRLGA